MQTNIIEFLIVCPMVFIAGFVDAVAGGGGLISLPAYLMSGLPVHYAIGTNKLSSGMGSALAKWMYAKKGYIDWKMAFCCLVCALIGSALGANIALLISDSIFKNHNAGYSAFNCNLHYVMESFECRKRVIVTTNFSALFVFFTNGKIVILLGLATGVLSIAGNYLGTRIFDKGGAKSVKPLMILVFFIFFVKVLFEII